MKMGANPGEGSTDDTGVPAQITIVEDDEGLIRLIQKRLHRLKLSTTVATSGKEAIAQTIDHPHTLLLLDYRLPDMTGKEVIESLAEKGCTVPFIVMTGHGDEKAAVEMMKLGARDYLIKEEDFLDLIPQVVKRVVDQLVTERTLAEAQERLMFTQFFTERAEERIRQSEDRFRNIFENANDGIVYLDFDGRIVEANDEAVHILRETREELLGRHFTNVGAISPDDVPVLRACFEKALSEGKFTLDLTISNGRNDRGYLECSGTLMSEGGKPTGVVLVIRDITERRHAEEVLRESEEKYRTILENIEDSYYEVDLEGNFTFFNQPLCRLLGYSEEKLMGMNFRHYTDEETAEMLYKAFNLIFRTGKAVRRVEWEIVRKNGQKRYVEGSASLITRSDGKARGFRGIVRDITEHKEAEEALRESEAKYRTLVESTLTIPWKLDLDSKRFTYIGKQVEQILGYPMESWVDLDFWAACIHPEDRDEAVRMCLETTERDENHDFEYRAIASDGRVVWIRDIVSVLSGDQGPTELVGFMLDITEQKQAEEAIRQLSDFPEENPHPVFRTDLEGKVHYANPAAWKLMEEMGVEDKNVTWLLPRDRKQLISRIRDENKVMAQAQYRRKGHVFSSEIHLPKGGNTAHIYLTDITEQLRQQETSRRLFTAVEQAAEIIMVMNPEGAFQYVNPAFERITGFSRKDVMGKKTTILESGKHDRAFYQDMWNTLKSGKVWSGRIINRRRDGSFYEEETTISPVRSGSGKIVNYVQVGRDVTQEVALEEQLRQAQKLEAVGQLAGGIAHDFNNIITGIIGFAELSLRELPDRRSITRYLETIIKKSDQAAQLIRQLLAFSRRQILDMKRVNLNSVVFDSTRFLQRIIGENIELSTVFAQNVKTVEADPSALEQIITNLCVNARDAMPEGGRLQIKTENVALTKEQWRSHTDVVPGDYVLLSVADTGGGISEELQQHIFEPFFTTKESGQGTGLGLSMVYGLVKQHSGFIDCISELGKGTTFEIYLPALPAESEHPEKSLPIRPKGGHETILVVEDDLDVLKALQNMIQNYGYTVVTADNGSEALKVYKDYQGSIDLIITDIVMPKMGGMDLYDTIQQIEPGKKFLFVSGYGGRDVQKKFDFPKDTSRKDNVTLLQKPFRSDEIARVIREVLDQ